MNIKAIAWDVDGTLVDSEPLHLEALLACCAQYNVDIDDLPVDCFVGVNIRDVWKALSSRFPADLSFTEWQENINSYYQAHCHQLFEIDAAKFVIETLNAWQIPQVAVSNSHRQIVDANLNALGIASVLQFSLSLDEVLEPKPHPFPYEYAAQKLAIPAQHILAVEDSHTGAKSALNAKCVVAFLGANPPAGTLPIQSLREIIELVKG